MATRDVRSALVVSAPGGARPALLLAAAFLAVASPCAAQLVSTEQNPGRLEQRDEQFAELARDVAAMDRLLGLVTRVVKLVAPSVVHIEAQPVREYHVQSGLQEAGSGVIVRFDDSADPTALYVITNRHVIRHSDEPHVRIQLFDGRLIQPERIWSDSQTDIAVMRIRATGVFAARVGDAAALEIGEQVLAMGSPFGLSQSVTRGIISAKGRYNLDLGEGEVKYQNFLQTDAAINPGNSGGPLINLRGEVVGLNTAIASNSGGNEGIGFSIPIDIAFRVAGQLVRGGAVHRGYLGVKLDAVFDEQIARQLGLPSLVGTRIKTVEPQSPAAAAELLPDDVIIQFGGIRIEDDDHLISLVKLTETGKEVELVVYRGGQPLTKRVRIGDVGVELVEAGR